MRMLVDIQMPVEPFNARVKDGTAGQIIQSILGDEPSFLHFNASVSFHPCMTPEDLGKAGLDEIGRKYR